MATSTKDFITLVSGLPRSGTSMMMQMLEAGGMPVLTDNIRTADDDNPKGYYEFEPVKQLSRDYSWLREARGKVIKVIYRLLYDLPAEYEYRVIFLRRDLQEVVASQNVMIERRGGQATSSDDPQVVKLFEHDLRTIEAWLEQHANFSVLFVNYRDVVQDTPRIATEIDRFLACQLNTEAMIGVVDPSLHRQRRG